MNWKQLLESISESVNDHLRLCNDSLVAENRILRKQINGRMRLSDGERTERAEIGAKLGKQALVEIATMATPDPVLAWHRKFADQKVTSSEPPKSVGRPRVDQASEDLVIRMARANRAWGYDRIVGALANLGYTMSDQTVGNILKRHDIPPAPARKTTTTWREFIRMHMAVLRAQISSPAQSGIGAGWCALLFSSSPSVVARSRSSAWRPLSMPNVLTGMSTRRAGCTGCSRKGYHSGVHGAHLPNDFSSSSSHAMSTNYASPKA